MTQQTPIVDHSDGYAAQFDTSLAPRHPRLRRPAPRALVVARCVYVAVLVAIVLGMPPLLRSVGSAL